MSVTTTATQQAAILATVQKQLIAEAKIMFTVSDFSAQVGKGAKSVGFPRAGDLDPADKVVGTDSTAQTLTYATDTLALDQKAHTYIKLEDSENVQSVVDVEFDIISRGGKGMAKKMDTYIYNTLKAGASASDPVHVLDWFQAGDLGAAQIREARKLLNIQDVPQEDRYMLINPEQEAELLAIADFVDASKYGNAQAVQNGELGRLYGFRVIMSTICEADEVLCYHKSACAFARQIEPTWEKARLLKAASTEYSLYSLYGAKILDSGKRVVRGNDQTP